MLELTVTITGKQYTDLVDALQEVIRDVEKECIEGFNSNDTGSYTFTVTGEEETTDHE